MKFKRVPVLALLLSATLVSPALLAYGGGGGGGSSCEEPRFYDESPANHSSLPVFSEFRARASDNTDLATLEVKVNGEQMQPIITPQRSGSALIEVRLAAPISTPGQVRINLRARSKEGCENFLPVYLEVKP